MLQQPIDDVLGVSTDVGWAISIRDAAGHELVCRNGDHAMNTASVGKLLLLIEVARRCAAGDLSGATVLRRNPQLLVSDSGLWQHLQVNELAIDDLCVLVASVSDNTATNVLLEKVGLPSLGTLSRSLGLVHTALLDYVRDQRGPEHPPTLSTGSASELSDLMSRLSRNELISRPVSELVTAWLALGVDLSMVASAFDLDPLAHTQSDRDIFLRNKTGTDSGVRVDVGTIERNEARYAYAVIANWHASNVDLRGEVLSAMNAIGTLLRTALEGE